MVFEQIQSDRDPDLLYSEKAVELGGLPLSTETATHVA
jgi:hypothetical protein